MDKQTEPLTLASSATERQKTERQKIDKRDAQVVEQIHEAIRKRSAEAAAIPAKPKPNWPGRLLIFISVAALLYVVSTKMGTPRPNGTNNFDNKPVLIPSVPKPSVAAKNEVASRPAVLPSLDSVGASAPPVAQNISPNTSENVSHIKTINAARTDSGTDVKLIRAVVCRRISNRRPASGWKTFSLKKASSMAVWTEVQSSRVPNAIRHVYYLNGSKRFDVSLPVTHKRMRTWSTMVLRSRRQLGRWRVDIIDGNGQLLGRVAFKVSP